MKCELALNQITEYLEDRLDAPLRVVLEHHFSECASCREELDGARELAALFKGLPLMEPPHDFRAKTLARIEAEAAKAPASRRAGWFGKPASWKKLRLSLALGAAALALAFTHGDWSVITSSMMPSLSKSPVSNGPAQTLPRAEVLVSGAPSFTGRVGDEMTLYLKLRPAAALRNGKVTLTNASDGLQLISPSVSTDRGQVIWQGDLGSGRPLTLTLRFRADRPDVHEALIHVEGDWQDYQRQVFLPIFDHPASPSAKTLRGNLSVSDALKQLSGQLGVVIATDLTHQRPQWTEVSLKDPKGAIREVAAQRRMEFIESGGAYNVYDTDIPKP